MTWYDNALMEADMRLDAGTEYHAAVTGGLTGEVVLALM